MFRITHSTISGFVGSDILSDTSAKLSAKGTEANENPFESVRERDLLGQEMLPEKYSSKEGLEVLSHKTIFASPSTYPRTVKATQVVVNVIGNSPALRGTTAASLESCMNMIPCSADKVTSIFVITKISTKVWKEAGQALGLGCSSTYRPEYCYIAGSEDDISAAHLVG